MRQTLIILVLFIASGASAIAEVPQALVDQLRPGVAIYVGDDLPTAEQIAGSDRLVLMVTDRADDLRAKAASSSVASQIFLTKRGDRLPVHDYLATTLVVDAGEYAFAEYDRAVAPFGTIAVRTGKAGPSAKSIGDYRVWQRPLPKDMGEWTVDTCVDPGRNWVADDSLDPKLASIGTVLRSTGDGYRLAQPERESDRQALWLRFIVGNNRSRKGYNRSSFVVAGGRLFAIQPQDTVALFGTPDGKRLESVLEKNKPPLVARDAFSGVLLWTRLLENRWSRILSGNDRVLLVLEGNDLVAIDPISGDERWRQNIGSHKDALLPPALPLTDGGALTTSRSVRRFSPDGTVAWELKPGNVTDAVIAGDRVIVEYAIPAKRRKKWTAGDLVAIDLKSGTEAWRLKAATRSNGLSLASANANWIVIDNGDRLQVLNVKDGKVVLDHERKRNGFRSGRGGELAPGNMARLLGDRIVLKDSPPRLLALPSGDPIADDLGGISGLGSWACNGGGSWTRGMIEGLAKTITHPQPAPAGSYSPGGTCGTVNPVAYHSVYQTPLNCECLSFSHNVRGFLGLAPTALPDASVYRARPTAERGPAFGKIDPAPAPAGSWPQFRGDLQRSAAGPKLGTLKEGWQTKLPLRSQAVFQLHENRMRFAFPGALTAPTVSGDAIAVGLPESREVIVLNRRDGSVRWRLPLDAAIDSPPSLTKSLAVFGTADGMVQAHRLTDGALVWRTRVAPVGQRMVAHGQLQSQFPVTGSVSVTADGRVFATAGITGEIGVQLAELDLATGKTLRYEMLPLGGFLNDVIVADGAGKLHFGPYPLEPDALATFIKDNDRRRQRYLKKYKKGQPPLDAFFRPYVNNSRLESYDPARLLSLGESLIHVGRTVAFDTGIKRITKFDGNLWGQGFGMRRAILWAWNDNVQIGAEQYQRNLKDKEDRKRDDLELGDSLVCYPRLAENKRIDRRNPGPKPLWTLDCGSERIWALAIAGDLALAAGPLRGDDIKTDPRLLPGVLRMVSVADGTVRQTLSLPAAPIQDGIAVIDGGVVVTCWDGSVVTFVAP